VPALRQLRLPLPSLAASSPRTVGFVASTILTFILFRDPLRSLVNLSLHDDQFSHIILIPFISGLLAYMGRQRIFHKPRYSLGGGLALLLPGFVLFSLVKGAGSSLGLDNRLSLLVLAAVLVWIGTFVVCYGGECFRAALFPTCFLLLMIPLPPVLLDRIVSTLQKGSAEASYALFKLAGVPVLRQGLHFSLPGVDIEVARECSGIRSSLSLLIASLVAGYLVLRSGWRRACFSLFTVPIVIFKNAVRIVTLSWLGVYVDRDFLYGRLHHQYGGLVFSLLALAILAPALFVLQRSETRRSSDAGGPPPGQPQPANQQREEQDKTPQSSAPGGILANQ